LARNFNYFLIFLTGGMDASNYNDGQRGGKIRVRTVEETDKKTLTIHNVPFGATTTLMEMLAKLMIRLK
jgi:topoisomerase-4 subunit A